MLMLDFILDGNDGKEGGNESGNDGKGGGNLATSSNVKLFDKQEKTKASKVLAEMKRDPLLAGMSPLYKDYESQYWWFEIPKFVVTLILCGLVTL